MSTEFRQRTPGEYAQIIWKRKWYILLPALVIFSAVAIVVWRLPDVYESETLLIVRPPTIRDTSVVPTLSDSDLSVRISNIQQTVGSRSALQPLVERYDLYARERANGDSIEEVIDYMRMDIRTEINRGRNDVTNGFIIRFRGRDPRTTQAVASELAGMYVNAQTRSAGNDANATRTLFEQQVAEAKTRLDEIDARRLQYMQQRIGTLPSEAQGLVGQLSGLSEQQRTLTTEIGRANDTITLLRNQQTELERQRQQEIQDASRALEDVRTSLGYGNLIQQRARIQAELQDMRQYLRPGNPDMTRKEGELTAVQREIEQMESGAQERVEQRRREMTERVDPRVGQMRASIQYTESQRQLQQQQLQQVNAAVSDIQRRLNEVPTSEVGLESLNREYQTLKAIYDQMLTRAGEANLGATVVANQQGETIQVIDPASLPSAPVAPKRLMLTLLGLGVGLGAGLVLAAAVEVPRLMTIQTTEDAQHYTGLTVLASVPELFTAREERRIKSRRMMFAAASIVLTLASIPALALILRESQFFERFI